MRTTNSSATATKSDGSRVRATNSGHNGAEILLGLVRG